ncbi:MAG: hypothetical protein ACPGJS_16125 [Flammeovirgaceae bacterium]
MKVGEIRTWLTDELNNPFAWQRVLMHLLPDFRAEGHFFHTITDEDELSDQLLKLVDKTITKFYQINLLQFNH